MEEKSDLKNKALKTMFLKVKNILYKISNMGKDWLIKYDMIIIYLKMITQIFLIVTAVLVTTEAKCQNNTSMKY